MMSARAGINGTDTGRHGKHGKRLIGKHEGKSDIGDGSVLGDGSMAGSSVKSKMTSMFGLGLGRGGNTKGECNQQGR